jgi:ubiquinone biosynthesis protein Coq4
LVAAATQNAFEAMTEAGSGDAGALALGLRHGVTGVGLRALAAKTLHVAAAAPERLADIYDNAAAGWLSGPVFNPKLRVEEPLPISAAFWTAFWALVRLPDEERRKVLAERTLQLAGQLDPRINARMAAAAAEYRGVAAAAAKAIPGPYDLDALASCPPASLGYALRQEALRPGGAAAPFGRNITPLLRHMPAPLNHINIEVLQSLTLWRVVAGYSPARTDQVAFGAFLMGQVSHHYSALSTAVTLAILALERPRGLEVTLDGIFKGWAHGRETPPLIGVDWAPLWRLRMDEARAALGVTAFDSPFVAAVRQLERPKG